MYCTLDENSYSWCHLPLPIYLPFQLKHYSVDAWESHHNQHIHIGYSYNVWIEDFHQWRYWCHPWWACCGFLLSANCCWHILLNSQYWNFRNDVCCYKVYLHRFVAFHKSLCDWHYNHSYWNCTLNAILNHYFLKMNVCNTDSWWEYCFCSCRRIGNYTTVKYQ